MSVTLNIDVKNKDGANAFNVCYKLITGTEWVCQIVNTLPTTIQGLPDGNYEVKVNKICNVTTAYNWPIFYGGDTFITRFALKRKHQFFLQDRIGLPDGSDINQTELGNVAYPNYWLDTNASFDHLQSISIWDILKSVLTIGIPVVGIIRLLNSISKVKTLFKILLGISLNRFDCDDTNFIEQKGKIYLHSIGIPYFLVESDINTDLREATNNKEGDFYPNTTSLNWWLQSKNVPFKEDNQYHYNHTYSKQNHESYIAGQTPAFDPSKECRAIFPQRVIYSDQFYPEDIRDNWLIFRTNNHKDFPITSGKLLGVEGIEDAKVLVRLENTSMLYNAFSTLQAEGEEIQVSNGGMFQKKPIEFFKTDLGYLGSQHSAFLSTEFGHVSTDAKRGSIYLIENNKPRDIALSGLKNWFKENLPFKIKEDFPELKDEDIDNTYKGIGISLSFDKRFNRLFVTKLDYQALSDEVKYDSIEKCFYIDLEQDKRQKIALSDRRYFCNKSWTVSYNFFTRSWVSFHSFTPNYYIDYVDYFQSGLNNNSYLPGLSSVWDHNKIKTSYQVYYGQLYSFSVTSVKPFSVGQSSLNYIKYAVDTFRYHNDSDKAYYPDVGFNRALVYNDYQTSGVRHLVTNNVNDMSQDYPKLNTDGIEILQTRYKGTWQFNDIWDVSNASRNVPLLLTSCNGMDEYVNLASVNYMKDKNDIRRLQGDHCMVKLTNDSISNLKFILKYVLTGSTKIE